MKEVGVVMHALLLALLALATRLSHQEALKMSTICYSKLLVKNVSMQVTTISHPSGVLVLRWASPMLPMARFGNTRFVA